MPSNENHPPARILGPLVSIACGVVISGFGIIEVFQSSSSAGDIGIEIPGFSVSNAGPGIVMLVLGVFLLFWGVRSYRGAPSPTSSGGPTSKKSNKASKGAKSPKGETESHPAKSESLGAVILDDNTITFSQVIGSIGESSAEQLPPGIEIVSPVAIYPLAAKPQKDLLDPDNLLPQKVEQTKAAQLLSLIEEIDSAGRRREKNRRIVAARKALQAVGLDLAKDNRTVVVPPTKKSSE